MPASIPLKNMIIYIHIFKTLGFCLQYFKLQFTSLLTYENLPFWKSKQMEKQIVKLHDTQKYCITLFPLSVSKDFLTSESIISVSKLTFKKMKRFLKPPKHLLLKTIYRMNLPFKVNLKGLPWWRSGQESTCQCRGHGFDPWSGKIAHAAGNKARALQLLSLRSRAREPQLLKPVCLEPMLRNKRSHRNEKPAHRKEEQPPLAAARESPCAAMKTQCSRKLIN